MGEASCVIFWSGGKDATMVLDEMKRAREVAALVTTYDESSGRVPFQAVTIEAVRLQARSLGVPLVEVPLPPSAPNDVYVERVLDALSSDVDEAVGEVVFGDVHLDDIRDWREEMFRETRFRTVYPLWHRDTADLARRFLGRGYRAVVTTVDTRALSEELLGVPYDESFLDGLPDGVDACGEGGEFHTAVWDGPLFESSLRVVHGEHFTSGAYASIETGFELSEPRSELEERGR